MVYTRYSFYRALANSESAPEAELVTMPVPDLKLSKGRSVEVVNVQELPFMGVVITRERDALLTFMLHVLL